METELKEILAYWMQYAPDEINGGFYGKRDDNNIADPQAPKGIVLNSRILWSFSAAYNLTKNEDYLLAAQRAYEYILKYFIDREYGGAYWSVDYSGSLLNGRKQIYGMAFCIYAFTEYYKAVGNPAILDNAREFFNLIERYAYDKERQGYYEAFGRSWQSQTDFRLSQKDLNEQKTMNTHLHILEAYSNLFGVWPDFFLGRQIENLLEVFQRQFVDKNSGHLILFFDAYWTPKSRLISYGHDIEAGWLLQEAAQKIGYGAWEGSLKNLVLQVTTAAECGLDSDGGLWYEYEPDSDSLVMEKHWWPQAEAMVGFMNAYQLAGDIHFLEQSFKSWLFIKKYLKDYHYGEWYWGVDAQHASLINQDKLGFWKCPYHNTRSCMEMIKRLQGSVFLADEKDRS